MCHVSHSNGKFSMLRVKNFQSNAVLTFYEKLVLIDITPEEIWF